MEKLKKALKRRLPEEEFEKLMKGDRSLVTKLIKEKNLEPPQHFRLETEVEETMPTQQLTERSQLDGLKV